MLLLVPGSQLCRQGLVLLPHLLQILTDPLVHLHIQEARHISVPCFPCVCASGAKVPNAMSQYLLPMSLSPSEYSKDHKIDVPHWMRVER